MQGLGKVYKLNKNVMPALVHHIKAKKIYIDLSLHKNDSYKKVCVDSKHPSQ